MKEVVNNPAHYGGADNPYEVIKVAEAWGLDKDAYLFNVLKYIGRSGKKDDNPPIQDLKKALFYLERRIKLLKTESSTLVSSSVTDENRTLSVFVS
jgi:hypothetical protein